ncbi:MAG: carbon storage regulator [Porticoccaceae bacterium]
MLKLTRLAGEAIVIETPDGDIRIVFSEVDGRRVRVAIEAPDDFHIIREELLLRDNPE